MMEGFKLQWGPFPDPLLNADPSTLTFTTTSDGGTNGGKLLPLVSLSPMNFSDYGDDINNNSPGPGVNMTGHTLTLMTLDPLMVTGQDDPEGDFNSTNGESDTLLPKFQEILRKNEVVDVPQISVEDVDQGIYFSIHDLESIDHHHYSGEGQSDDSNQLCTSTKVGGFLMDDLGDCGPELGDPSVMHLEEMSPSTTTTATRTPPTPHLLLGGDDSNSGGHSSGHSFDALVDLDPEEGEEGVVEEDEYGDGVTLDMDLEEGDTKQELKCKFCGFVCCSKSSLGIHERRHTGERPYACKYCGRLFNSAQCCKHHERLHTGDKPFECQYCGKKYAVSTRLKRHERVHTREEPYKCGEPGCGKTFRWFDAFRDHRNTHNGVPLYLCSVCGKSFTSYLKFYYHERGHFLKRERDKDKLNKAKLAGNAEVKVKPQKKSKPRAKKGKNSEKLQEV